MKKLFFILSLLIFISCTKENVNEPTELNVQIIQNPVEGLNVQSASVSFIGTITGSVKKIPVKVEWIKETSTNENPEVMSTTEIVFSEGRPEPKASSCLVKQHAGYASYYYARITWSDSRGLNTVQSTKALCK